MKQSKYDIRILFQNFVVYYGPKDPAPLFRHLPLDACRHIRDGLGLRLKPGGKKFSYRLPEDNAIYTMDEVLFNRLMTGAFENIDSVVHAFSFESPPIHEYWDLLKNICIFTRQAEDDFILKFAHAHLEKDLDSFVCRDEVFRLYQNFTAGPRPIMDAFVLSRELMSRERPIFIGAFLRPHYADQTDAQGNAHSIFHIKGLRLKPAHKVETKDTQKESAPAVIPSRATG
jgi:hypothetical protein